MRFFFIQSESEQKKSNRTEYQTNRKRIIIIIKERDRKRIKITIKQRTYFIFRIEIVV